MGAKLTSRLPMIGAALEAKANAAVRKAAFDVQAQAKQRAPVDTGALRTSIGVEMTGPLSAEVATAMDYAEYVEYGTSKMGAQPYMTPAAEAVRPGFERAMGQIVQ